MPVLPDTLQNRCRGRNDVPGVLSGDKQFFRGHVAVVRLFNREGGRFDEYGNKPAILVLFTQLFRGPFCVLTDCLAEQIVFSDLLAEAAAADDLLLCWRGFFKRHAAFPVQLPDRSLKDHAEIFADKGRVCQGPIECCPDAQHMQFTCNAVPHSLYNGQVNVQRGVRLKADMPEETESSSVTIPFSSRQPDAAEGISIPLLTKMSSERTLAVQAALMQKPEKAVALMVWRMCSCVFAGCVTTPHPFRISLTISYGSLTENAPSGKGGAAFDFLMTEKERLKALLPAGWEKDFTTFFALDGEVLMSLMAFCAACSVDGVQTRDNGHTSRSPLDTVETAIDFHLRDWWQPTKENYFGSQKHTQIVDALKDAGLTGAAGDAEKMKKGDAAGHAEFFIKDNRWVPAWLQAPQHDATESIDTDNKAIAA